MTPEERRQEVLRRYTRWERVQMAVFRRLDRLTGPLGRRPGWPLYHLNQAIGCRLIDLNSRPAFRALEALKEQLEEAQRLLERP
jgi:hypothetical protein